MTNEVLPVAALAQLDNYFKNRFSAMFEEMMKSQKKHLTEMHRLPFDKKEINDRRMKAEIERLALGTPLVKPDIAQIWANAGSIAAPSTSQQNLGWSTSTPPESYFFNYLFNLIETYLLYINQQGICGWDAVTDYPIDALTKGSDGNIYRGLTSPNLNNDPTTDAGVHWYALISNDPVSRQVGSFLYLAYNSGSPVPNYLDCLAQDVSRVTYATLFDLIGVTWGSGDGSTTFTLPPPGCVLVGQGFGGYPNLTDGTGSIGGSPTHAITTAELAPHTHTYNQPSFVAAFSGGGTLAADTTTVANTGSTGSGAPHNNIQPSMVGRLLIKYQ